MNKFISYTDYKNILNETYDSFQELKILAKDIFDEFSKTVKIEGTRSKFYTRAKKDQLYYIKRLVKRKFKVIDEFVNSAIGIIVYTEGNNFSRGSYVQPDDYDELENVGKSLKELRQIYPNGIIVIYKLDINVILHELTHAYDDFRAEGKLLNTKLGRSLGKKVDKFNAMSSSQEKDKFLNGPYMQTYYRTPHELSAFFSKTMNSINFFSDKNEMYLRDFRDVYDDFIENFQGYQFLTPKDRKMLARKFSQYYYRIKEKNTEE